MRVVGQPATGNAMGTTALATRLGETAGLVVSASGAVVVCDRANNQIRSYPLDGPPQLLAGALDGTPGFLGENLTAASSMVAAPVGLVEDQRHGVFYFCDSGNDRIRFFMPGNRLYTAAGGGSDASETVAHSLNARLAEPFGLALDNGGNLYFSERGAGRVRRLAPSGGLITLGSFPMGQVGPVAVNRTGDRLWVGVDGMVQLFAVSASGATTIEQIWQVPGAVITSLAFNERDTLYAVSTAGEPSGLKDTFVHAIPVASDGRIDARYQASVIGGTGRAESTDQGYSVPVTRVPDARTQTIAGVGFCSLFVDVAQSAAADVLAGELLFGNSYLDGAGIRWGEIVKFSPTYE